MAKKEQTPNGVQELKNAIKNNQLQRLYFFHGEETFLLHHYLEQIKKLLLDELTESFNFHKLTSETFDVRAFADCVENLPMMADNTLVWVDEVDLFKMAESDRDKIVDVISDIPDYCTVIFTYVTASWKPDKRLKKLWEAVDKHGVAVEFAKQEQRDLIPWIQRHFATHKKKIAPDLCLYLIEITGGTMTALAGEISKIAAYSGTDTVTRSDIDAVTEPVLDAVVFQMTDLMGEGNYGAALLKLRTLLKMQQEPILILGTIGSHFRRLSTAKTIADSGRSYSELMRLCAIKSDYVARKTMSAAAKFPSEFYRRAAELILETDNCMKTSFDDSERLLEVLVLQLAREARHG